VEIFTPAALDEHRALMQRAGNMHRLSEAGWLKVFRSTTEFDPKSFDGTLYERFGIGVQPLNADEVYELEPSLKRIFRAGFLLTDSAQVNNPGLLIKEYAEQFVRDGGILLKTDITSVFHDGSEFRLHSDKSITAKRLVIAAGPWSANLLNTLGYNVMLSVERGYHQHFHAEPGTQLNRTLHDVDAGYIMAPMEAGIRITTGVELARLDAPANTAQLTQVIPRAHEAFPLSGPTNDPIWKGAKHIGLMSGPITGKLLAQQISGEKTDIDLTPFRASRWVR